MTLEDFKKELRYNTETGQFFWLNWPRKEKLAGYLHGAGYIEIRIKNHRILAHRLAWLFVYGSWPVGIIDHRDRDKRNNIISNLRDTNQSVNQFNMKPREGSRFKGVTLCGSKWRARRGNKHIGNFSTKEEANAAYEASE